MTDLCAASHKARTGRPAKVLWLVKGLGRGGAERLIVSAARLIDRREFDVEVGYLLPWKDALVAELTNANVPVRCLGATNRSDVRWVWPLRRLLRDECFDIVHSHSPLVASGVRLAVKSLPRPCRPLLVSTEHNAWSSHGPLTRWANRVTFGWDHAHMAVSEATRRSLPERLQQEVQVVVHGTEPAAVQAAAGRRAAVRSALGISDDEVVVITVANLRSHKGYPDLLAAARMVLDTSRTPCRFVAVGQGPLEARLHAEHERLGLGDRFMWLGRRDDIFELLAGSDIFALSSRHEGFPIAIVEALAAGLPVVATDVGGVADAIVEGDNGYLVECGDIDGIARSIRRLVDDASLRHKMGQTAARGANRFDVAKAVRATEAVYAEMLDKWATSRSPDDHETGMPQYSSATRRGAIVLGQNAGGEVAGR